MNSFTLNPSSYSSSTGGNILPQEARPSLCPSLAVTGPDLDNPGASVTALGPDKVRGDKAGDNLVLCAREMDLWQVFQPGRRNFGP